MIYRNYSEIPYPFLHDAALVISKRYKLESIYIDPKGEISLTLLGMPNEDKIKDILINLIPEDVCRDAYILSNQDYDYSSSPDRTHIYTPDNINYTKL